MPAAPLPPMTTRQAKRLGKKTAGQFQYTASQMRRADRREEIERRKKQEEDKENRKRANKRKREEQEEKERSVKRKLFEEGKISLEDTWGKVRASQHRLNSFFKAPAISIGKPTSATSRPPCDNSNGAIQDAANKDNGGPSCDSQEETTVKEQATVPARGMDHGDGVSDDDLLKLLSPRPKFVQDTPPASGDKPKPQTRSQTRSQLRTPATVTSLTSSIPTRNRSFSLQQNMDRDDLADVLADAELTFAEDETAETAQRPAQHLEADAESFSSSFKCSRSVLSEMSVANVNTRAQEKPDTTSVYPNSGLLTPSKLRIQDAFASFDCGDFEDDEDELMVDKENSDPHQTPGKEKAKSKPAEPEKAEAGPSSSNKTIRLRGSAPNDDFEDIYDFGFNSGDDEFDEDVDDATLLALSTQRPKSDHIIDSHGSPRKLTPRKVALVKPVLLEFTPGKMMPPPPPRSRLGQGSEGNMQESLSFTSIGDDDFLEIVDQIEEELSQKSQRKDCRGKRKETVAAKEEQTAVFKVPNMKKKRILPWVQNPLPPPPSTQDYLMVMADEDGCDLEI